LKEHDLKSSLLCLRQGAMKFAELVFYEEKRRRIRPIHFWQEIQALSSSMFKEFFANIHGFQSLKKSWLVEMLERSKGLLQNHKDEHNH